MNPNRIRIIVYERVSDEIVWDSFFPSILNTTRWYHDQKIIPINDRTEQIYISIRSPPNIKRKNAIQAGARKSAKPIININL